MVRPAGAADFLHDEGDAGRAAGFFCSSLSVLSKLPTRAPWLPMLSVKLVQIFSTISARTEPSCAMAPEISLISSSCIIENRRAQCSSPRGEHQDGGFLGAGQFEIVGPGHAQFRSWLIQARMIDRLSSGCLSTSSASLAHAGGFDLAFDIGHFDHAFVGQHGLPAATGEGRGRPAPESEPPPAPASSGMSSPSESIAPGAEGAWPAGAPRTAARAG